MGNRIRRSYSRQIPGNLPSRLNMTTTMEVIPICTGSSQCGSSSYVGGQDTILAVVNVNIQGGTNKRSLPNQSAIERFPPQRSSSFVHVLSSPLLLYGDRCATFQAVSHLAVSRHIHGDYVSAATYKPNHRLSLCQIDYPMHQHSIRDMEPHHLANDNVHGTQ